MTASILSPKIYVK